MRFREHLWAHGFGVAEAMDTAQRGMGLSWEQARELIARSAARAAARRLGALACGAGTDQLAGAADHSLPAIIDRLRGAAGVRAVGGGAGDPDGQPGAGGGRPRAAGLPGRVRRAAEAGGPAGDPALAGRGVRPGAARLLGRHGLRGRGRDRARADRAGRRPGRRDQAVGARRGPGGGAAAAAAGRGPALHRRRLQLRRADPRGRRRRTATRCSGRSPRSPPRPRPRCTPWTAATWRDTTPR